MVRSPPSAQALAKDGIDARCIDLDAAAPMADGTVLWLAPPPPEGDADTRLARFLAQAPALTRLLYLSTSGVYGDCEGRWIDETAPMQPKSARGRRRADAEAQLQAWRARTGGDFVTLRVPGIYGPGRLPIARLQAGTPVLDPAQAPWTNRIHADDLAAAALCVLERGAAGAAYNIADGNPSTMADYFWRCADLLDLPRPPALPPEAARQQMSAQMWSFMEESKRLRVDRLRDDLGFRWQYPDLESGLPACLAGTTAT